MCDKDQITFIFIYLFIFSLSQVLSFGEKQICISLTKRNRFDLSSPSLIFQIFAPKWCGRAFVCSKPPESTNGRNDLFDSNPHTHSNTHKPISHNAQGWQAFTFKRLLWKAPLQCRRFQPQLYGEYIVVKLLMKTEKTVYSSKQLSVKDGEVIYSLYEEQYFFPL